MGQTATFMLLIAAVGCDGGHDAPDPWPAEMIAESEPSLSPQWAEIRADQVTEGLDGDVVTEVGEAGTSILTGALVTALSLPDYDCELTLNGYIIVAPANEFGECEVEFDGRVYGWRQ